MDLLKKEGETLREKRRLRRPSDRERFADGVGERWVEETKSGRCAGGARLRTKMQRPTI